jgi:hypothetical protein
MGTVAAEELSESQYTVADELVLAEGEQIEFVMENSRDSAKYINRMLLTDCRLIHVSGSAKRRVTSFISLDHVTGVDVSFQKEGNGVYIWAVLAFIIAALLWQVIDNDIGRYGGSLLVAAMGVYLVVDHLMASGSRVVVVRAVNSEIRHEVNSEADAVQAYEFVNALYSLKNHAASGPPAHSPRSFAPR